MNIAILGFGTVGKGAYEIIKNNGLEYITVSKILKRKGSKMDLPEMVDNIDDIINDDSIDTIVECMGGKDPAFDYVSRAMMKKKNVVTSNKLLVATHYDELIKLSDENDVYFLFEASVGGGMVSVSMNGKYEVVDVNIKKEVVDPDDVEMLVDLVKSAVNSCTQKITEAKNNGMPDMSGFGM